MRSIIKLWSGRVIMAFGNGFQKLGQPVPLSNFVAEPLTVLGFDPTVRLVDALEARIA